MFPVDASVLPMKIQKAAAVKCEALWDKEVHNMYSRRTLQIVQQ